MNKKNKPKLTWQGIGISSNPFQRRDPLSVHLQAYLEEAAESADEHIIIVADDMQVSNYQTLYRLDENHARKIALKKGRSKQRALEIILRARGIDNIKVVRFGEIYGTEQEKTVQIIRGLFESDPRVRDAVLKCVPKRLVKKAANLNDIAQYAITEIGLILSMPGVKFGHEGESLYDSVAAMLNKNYGIGKTPEFVYSKRGLEFVAGRNISVEPYSALVSDGRFLVTDSKKEFVRKLDGLDQDEAAQVSRQLQEDGMYDRENAEEFYKRRVAPTRKALGAPKRRMVGIAASIAAGLISLVSGIVYVHADARDMRQNRMAQISIFGLNGDMETCRRANRDALDKANADIESKYHIKNYFKS